MNRAVYMDYQSTTPVDPLVLDAMLPFFSVDYGNAHSTHHAFGWRAAEAVEQARRALASSIGAQLDEVFFTSGATESINIALQGVVNVSTRSNSHIVSVCTEHKCSLATLDRLRDQGCDVTLLNVPRNGVLSAQAVADSLTPQTALVSVMWVNNEIGTIQPIRDIARVCARAKVPFHTDAAQALGKVPINVERAGIGLASFSAHKTYGPKGIGALYCRRSLQDTITPLVDGGGQEGGLRGGTLPVPLIVGFGAAAAQADRVRIKETKSLASLRNRFLSIVSDALPDTVVHGSIEQRIAGNLNLGFHGVDSESLLAMTPAVAMSTGSACNSASPAPSHVLQALGVDYDLAHGSIRIGFGRQTTLEEVERAASQIVQAVTAHRAAA